MKRSKKTKVKEPETPPVEDPIVLAPVMTPQEPVVELAPESVPVPEPTPVPESAPAPAPTPAPERPAVEEQLVADVEYVIVPRHNLTAALTAAANGAMTIEPATYGEGQRWKLKRAEGSTASGAGAFLLENARGQRLTSFRASGSSKLTAQTSVSSEQQFYVDVIDWPYCKISPARYRSYSLDLNNASGNAGTTVCTWQYTADTDTPTHRQWMLCPLRNLGNDTGIDQLTEQQHREQNATCPDGVYDLAGRCVLRGAASVSAWQQLPRGIYVVCSNGVRRIVQK